jgi:hypothetical protein
MAVHMMKAKMKKNKIDQVIPNQNQTQSHDKQLNNGLGT